MNGDSARSRVFRIAVRRYPPFEQAIRAQWRTFEDEANTGLELELVSFDLHPLEEALFANDGMRNGDWDAAFVATDWIAAMDENRCALDLAPLLHSDPPQDYPEGWTPSLLRLQQIKGQVLGVPYHDGPECLIYRRDLFEEADIRSRYERQFDKPLAPPVTWEEFHRIARFLQRPSERLYGAAFAVYPDGHNAVYDFLLQLWTRGGDLFDASGALRLHTPQAVEALSFYREILADKDAVHPDCLKMESVATGFAFAGGEVAMMINWFGFATMAHTAPDSAVRGKVGVALIPHADHAAPVSLNVYWLLSIPAGSRHSEIAWQFLRHTQSPAMDKLTTTSGAIGCRRSTWSDAEVNTSIPFYHRMQQLHAQAREIPRRPDWPRIAAIIDTLMTETVTTSTPVADLLRQADLSLAKFLPVK